MHGGVKNNYEHNVVVMNLPLCPQTADHVNVIVWQMNCKYSETLVCIFLEHKLISVKTLI